MRIIFWGIMFISGLFVSSYALFSYGFLPLGTNLHPDMKIAFNENKTAIYTHVFASLVTLVIGPLQFSKKLRFKYINFHRWSGRVYLIIGVFGGGIAGLFMAQHAFGGLVAKVGFSASAIVWLCTGFMALYSILRKDVKAHQRWMIRNFSLTFSAVTLRVYLSLFMISDISFNDFYPVLAWLSWVPNILIAEWLFNAYNNAPHENSRQMH